MGFDLDTGWRISDINKEFELCNTFPRFLIVPASFKDEDLESVAKFRYFRRIPTAVWRHLKNGCFIVRSSQPTVGWFGWFRSELDEGLVQSYVDNTIPPGSERDINQITNTTEPNDPTNQDECDANLMLNSSGNDDTDDGEILGEASSASNNPKESSKQQQPTTQIMVDGGENGNGARQQQQQDCSEKTNLQHEEPVVSHETHLQQNNFNNNHQDATKVILSNTGKTVKLDMNPSECQASEDESITKDNTSTTTTTSTTTSTTMSTTTNLEAVNGNGSLNPLNHIIPSVIENNTTNNTAPTTPTSKMLIIDARSYTAAMANRAKGGGCECSEYYPRCEVQFMNLANIHSIRKSYHAIRSVCEAYSEQSNK